MKKETVKLAEFSVTNILAGGERRQVLVTSNGLSLYFTESTIVIWFSEGSDIGVGFDPTSGRPTQIHLQKAPQGMEPGQSVLDGNADGVPEVRRLKDLGMDQVFFRGEWFTKRNEGANTTIFLDGIETRVRYDKAQGRWVEVKKPD